MPRFDIKRHGRRIALTGIILICLVALGSLVSIPIASTVALRSIRPALGTLIGSEVVMDAQAAFRIFPKPILELSNLNIYKKTVFSVKSSSVNIDLGLFSLLSGEIEPISISAFEPTIELSSKDIPDSRQNALALLGGVIQSTRTLESTPLRTLSIRSGQVKMAGVTDPPLLNKIDATLSTTPNGRMDLEITAPWKDEAVEIQARIDPPDPKTSLKPATLLVKSAPATVQFDGTTTATGALQLNGSIDLKFSNLERVGTWLQIEPPLTFSTPLSIKGHADFMSDRVAVRDATVSLGKASLSGGIGLDFSGTRPLISGSLSAGDLDVTEFLSPVWPKQAQGWRTDPFLENITPNQDFDVRLSAERVNLGIVRIANVAVSVMAKDRTLDVTLAGSKLFQGAAKGKLSVAPIAAGYQASAHGSFDGIDIAQATLALMDIRKIEGQASGQFDFDSYGASADAIMRNLSGTSNITIANGTLIGVNLAALLKRIEARPLTAIRDMKGSKTDFETAHLVANISNGAATLTTAEMIFPPNTMSIKGRVNIGSRTLALEGLASGPETENGSNPAILPYSITGDFDDPIVTPDIGRILRRQGNSAPAQN